MSEVCVEGHDLRYVDLDGLDTERLESWFRSFWARGVWDLGDGRVLAAVDLIVHMNSWGSAIDSEDRDEFRRRWIAAEPTVDDIGGRMSWWCRHGRHAWEICSARLSGHQSSRTHRCHRCLDRGLVVCREEPRGYFGGPVSRSMGEIEIRLKWVDLDEAIIAANKAKAAAEALRREAEAERWKERSHA